MYSQFIHGKFVSNIGSGYRIVARSSNLSNEDSLKTMLEKYRFWGATPPETTVKAVGIFSHDNNLVLVKAETAVDDRNQLVINGDREFNQHRYVFIPVTSISDLKGRVFPLLHWMYKQPTPLLKEFNANFPPLPIPIFEEVAEISEGQVEKIQQCLQYGTPQRPLLLSTLAAVINGKHLLFTNETNNPPEHWIESILLLLPASVRHHISVAVGDLEEQQTTWAQLVVKVNQKYPRSVPENMIWLNRANQTFQGEFSESTFENPFVDYIYDHIAKAPETLKQLLKQLDTISYNDITLESLADSKIILHLILALSQEQQNEFLKKYLSGLDIHKWESLIPILIEENHQQGLLFAWEELRLNAVEHFQKCIPLMLKIWSNIVNSKLLLLLDKLQGNLPLAEILLKQELLEQPRREVENTAIVEKLVALCKSVVADKARSNCSEAWEFAIKLVTHQLFHQERERFLLLDNALSGEIYEENLLNSFYLGLAMLLPHIQDKEFTTSNLHKQLKSHKLQVSDLIATLLAERNAGLAKLPQIAKLTNMNSTEKDNFYSVFLRTWSPCKEDVKVLLVEVIKDSQNTHPNHNFSRDLFILTYGWFEENQPELKKIFDSLQQNYSFENWVNLAYALYKTENEQVEFLDSRIGDLFPIEVMQKWLPLIVDNESISRKLIYTSLAWQNLTVQGLGQLVRNSQQYVNTLMYCLLDSARLHWINSDFLHYLWQNWRTQKKVDKDLINVITSPSMINILTNHDWLNLQRLAWEPEIELELPLVVKTALTLEEKKCLQNDAIEIVARYIRPEQTHRLLTNCKARGLDFSEQKEILKAVQHQACNVNLIMPYLYHEGKAINPTEEQGLIELLLQLQLDSQERPDVEKFSVDVFTQYILPNRSMAMLKWWRDKAADKKLYTDAFSSATKKYVQDISIKVFKNYLQELNNYLLFEENLMFKAAFNSIPDSSIQLISDSFKF